MQNPTLNSVAFGDLERELSVTRKVLERLPEEHYGWKPHEKSMSLGQLATHVANLPGWGDAALAHDVLDFANAPRPPADIKTSKELLEFFDECAAGLRKAVAGFDMATYDAAWTMRNGDQVFVTKPRSIVYRIWSINHLIHHRAQLCLYLRLLNVPVPTVYFNTADDKNWVFE